MNQFKTRLQKGETLIGCWLNLGSSVTAEIVGRTGYDWVLIDLEHGAGVEKDVLFQLQALESTPATALVRVESFERQRIHRVLDMGAAGVMCPRINSVDEARKFAGALRYPPEGSRGVAKMVRATGFGRDFSEYHKNQKDNILGILQIESVEALDCIDEMAAIDGVDVLFVGPADLSMAMGIFGQFDHPRFQDAMKATVDAATKAGKAAGILLLNPADAVACHDLGMRMIACGADAAFVAGGAQSTLDQMNSILNRMDS